MNESVKLQFVVEKLKMFVVCAHACACMCYLLNVIANKFVNFESRHVERNTLMCLKVVRLWAGTASCLTQQKKGFVVLTRIVFVAFIMSPIDCVK